MSSQSKIPKTYYRYHRGFPNCLEAGWSPIQEMLPPACNSSTHSRGQLHVYHLFLPFLTKKQNTDGHKFERPVTCVLPIFLTYVSSSHSCEDNTRILLCSLSSVALSFLFSCHAMSAVPVSSRCCDAD